MSDKRKSYLKAKAHLSVAQRHLRELQVLFEEDENAHDMSTVEDVKQELEDLEARLIELPDDLLSEELD